MNIRLIALFITVPQIQSKFSDAYDDGKNDTFELINYNMLEKLKTRKLNFLEKEFLQKPEIVNTFKDYLSADIDYVEEYSSEEEENRRIEKNRIIYELAGARYSPLFKLKIFTTTENMTDL